MGPKTKDGTWNLSQLYKILYTQQISNDVKLYRQNSTDKNQLSLNKIFRPQLPAYLLKTEIVN